MDIMRYRDGQVIELWSQFDDLGLLQQLGLLPGSADTLPSAEGTAPAGDDVSGIVPHGARR